VSQTIRTLESLYSAFDRLSVEGGWHRRRPALWAEPAHNFLPHVWHLDEMLPILEAAGDLVSTEFADRRNLTMTNPVEGNLYPTVRTLVAAYQLMKPGEVAKSHRHTPNALRLILSGHGTYTTVEGARVSMNPGDVMLTPNWMWHAHDTSGGETCYWLDFLDVPLVHLLEAMFFERHPDGVEASVVDVAEAPIAFRWADTLARLEAAPDADDGMCERDVELGPPHLATIALHMQRFLPGRRTRTMRTTANSIFAVVRGSGQTTVDGQTLPWRFGDVVAVPAWRPYCHEAAESAVLLRVTDRPVMKALGLLRETHSD